jgi:hypothetical protein
MNQLEKDLIASINAPRRKFDMSKWHTKEEEAGRVATCGTACCLAGHIEAIRPKLAKRLLPAYVHAWGDYIDHAGLARAIYREETGKPCRLDFHGDKSALGKRLDEITREEAVAHIKGKNPAWPLL